jgi:hypothetical protein
MITTRWIAILALGCTHPRPVDAPPPMVLGRFEDDYGGRHDISERMWTHGSQLRYHIVRWNSAKHYLIARNDAGNPTDQGLWTRIDWMALPGMAPYSWAYCLSAYAARNAEAAESTEVARRESPRSGCNGFPFSRMQRRAR